MYKVGDKVMHRHDVCLVTARVANFRNNEDYYTLSVLGDESLVIHSPVSAEATMMRPLISKRDAHALVQRIPMIATVDVDERMPETAYKLLISSGGHEDLVRIIKTTYLRRAARASAGQKSGEKDKQYFRLAEKVFYSELAVALDKTYDETRNYVLEQLDASV